jgi:hypothetical protein
MALLMPQAAPADRADGPARLMPPALEPAQSKVNASGSTTTTAAAHSP